MKYNLRYYPDPILLTKCEEVTEFNSELHELLDAMQKILLSTKGIGISSNQCGALKRAFILKDKKGKIWEFINPILKDSNGIADIYEGCLSSPNVYEKVLTRANEVTVVAKDRNGVEFSVVAEGIEAVCVFHECLPSNALVQTDKGKIKIIDIVKDIKSYNVASFNHKTNLVEYKKILNYKIESDSKKKWVKLKLSQTGPNIQLKCTEEHLCAYIKNPFNLKINYIEAKKMKNKYVIRQIDLKKKSNKETGLYNNEQISALAGSLLGDACISPRGDLVFSHGEPNKTYAEYRKELFNGKIKRGYSGYRKEYSNYIVMSDVTEQTKYLRKKLYIDNKKSIKFLYKFINEISLAFWYMDDGCLKNPTPSSRSKNAYASFHTEGFEQADLIDLCKFLKKRFKLNFVLRSRKVRNKQKYMLALNVEDSKKFFKLVSPFIINHFNYKLPKEFISDSKKLDNKRLDFSLKKVTEVKNVFTESKLYDLTIEDNNNFFVNNTLVHNCDHLEGVFWFDKLPSRQVKRSVEKQWQKQKKKLNLV